MSFLKKHDSLYSGLLVGLILISAFLLRYESVRKTDVIYSLRADAKDYFAYAFNLKFRHVYSKEIGPLEDLNSPVSPDAVRSPGYPLFLLPFIDGPPTDKMLNKIFMVQAVISTITVFLAFMFFQGFMKKTGSIPASILTAISPHLVVANSYLLTESLFCFLLTLSGGLLILLIKKPIFLFSICFGMALGLASLVRPVLQYFPFLMLLFYIFHYGNKKGGLLFAGTLLGFVVIVSPWLIRNSMALKASGDTRLMINFLHHGMYPDFQYNDQPQSFGFPYRYDPNSKNIGNNLRSALQEMKRRFLSEPGKHIKWFIFKKPVFFWSWNIIQGMGDAFVYPVKTSPYFYSKPFQWTHALMWTLHPHLIILSVLGSVLAWIPFSAGLLQARAIITARYAALVLIYFTAVHMVGAPFPRYSVPLRPYLYGMAVYSLFVLFVLIRHFVNRRNPLTNEGAPY